MNMHAEYLSYLLFYYFLLYAILYHYFIFVAALNCFEWIKINKINWPIWSVIIINIDIDINKKSSFLHG